MNEELSDKLVTLIHKDYTIKQIEELYPELNSYLIINCLLSYSETDEVIIRKIKEYYDNYRINAEKCIIMADSHIGRKPQDDDTYESEVDDLSGNEIERMNEIESINVNDSMLWEVCNYAEKNNIKNMIHLGDLIEGNSHREQSRIEFADDQIKHLEYVNSELIEPYDFETFLLYGNHDYNAIDYDRVDANFYRKYKNAKLVGAGIGYIYIDDWFVKLSHPIDIYPGYKRIKNLNLECNLELAGHSHCFEIIEEAQHTRIKVPALTCLNDGRTIDKGFLVLENTGSEFVFRHIIDGEKIEKEIVLKK